jgi:hypothetical protein
MAADDMKKNLDVCLLIHRLLRDLKVCMKILNRWSQRVVNLSATRRYEPEEVRDLCRRILPPFWLNIGNDFISLPDEASISLACQVCASYHNDLAVNVPPDDGFSRDMEEREARVQAHMDASSSEDEHGF